MKCCQKIDHASLVMQPPFNVEAREQAGFGPEWYMPLATQPKTAAIAETLQEDFVCMQLQGSELASAEAMATV